MNIKKLISFLLAVILLLSFDCISTTANAVSLNSGTDALKSAFIFGKGPKTDGYAIDYHYYTPVKNNDSEKYPLVIWLHGKGDGAYEGKQIKKSNICYWASSEYQSRFSSTEGAFILAPRSPEEKFIYWDDCVIYPLRAAIDDFINKNINNIDVTRIYIGGYSMGGKMTLKMITAYPEMFAAAFPICPAWSPSAAETSIFCNIPVWLTSGKTDPLVNYTTFVMPLWNNITKTNKHTTDCRFSTLSQVRYADGKKPISSHFSWFSVNNDMFSASNGNYPYMTTVNGTGKTVTLTYPNGMISWLSKFYSRFDGSDAKDSGNLTLEINNICSVETFLDFLGNTGRTISKIYGNIAVFFR